MRRSSRLSSRKVRRRAAERKRLVLECLDPRLLLAGDVVIAEFMAVNGSTLADVDGEFSDWFEVHNTGSSPVNLDGYFATDDEEALSKWRFPSLVLAAGERRVVFASGKDRANPAGELHTNFSLSADGEFFALVRPDGSTIEHAYAPAFPPQLSDISYGQGDVAIFDDSLIDDGATLTTLVPTSNALGTSWTQPAFDDSAWIPGESGVGYDTRIGAPVFALIDIGSSSGRNVAGGVPEGQIGMLNNSTLPLPPTNVTSTAATGSHPFTIAIDNGGRGGTVDWRDRGDSSSPDPLALLAEDHVKNNLGFVNVTLGGLPEGIYTVTSYHADLGFSQCEAIKVFVNGVEQADSVGRSNFDLNINLVTEADIEATAATFTILSNGVDPVTILFDGSAASDREVPLSGLKLVANGPLYQGLIETNLQLEMFSQRSSAYARVPFSIGEADAVDTLTLHMHYDDGFVAYLNGTEVARRNAPPSVVFDSTASIDRPDNQALAPEAIDLSSHAHLLVDGHNVLAIHGLNDSVDSPRFLFAPRLMAQVLFESQEQYFTTPTPAAANVPGALGIVGDTSFSVDRGFYDAPFQVAITSDTPGAVIRYTIDGSAPTAASGQVYSAPIDVTTTTTLRAAAYRPGFLPSNVDTQTYIFLADVIRQDGAGLPTNWGHAGPDYAMDQEIVNDPRYSGTIIDDLKSIPTLSLVLDLNDWFGPGGQ